jgi:hypothetical protein
MLEGDSLREYFYVLNGAAEGTSLYDELRASENFPLSDLRLCWRMRSLECATQPTSIAERTRIDKAFNILANPELRAGYDSLRRDDDAPPLFPYGGFGSILVEGKLSEDRQVFFGNRILAYKPEMISRRFWAMLRQCEFLSDQIILRDTRRELEVWLDSNLLDGLRWDITWNQWKHWLKTRIEVDATFVRTGKYQFLNGEWVLRTWWTALPSRIHASVPGGLATDIDCAQAIHELLGRNADIVEKARAEVEKQPVEQSVVQEWFDRLSASPHLKAQHITWRADYEAYYFEQLRRRAKTWFLFRDEYLFILPSVLISEMPQPGHATYLFAVPPNLDTFMERYARVSRDDIRHNRANVAAELGFVGRVVRGTKKKRWLSEVLKHSGEMAEYIDPMEN